MFLPLVEALVVVRQRDTVWAVAHPVHGAQRGVIERSFAQVIFQDDVGARDTCGFAKKLRDVGGVMEHIDKEANVKGSIGKGQLRAIKRAARDPASWPRNDFHSFYDEIGPALGEQSGDGAITTTDIQDTVRFRWDQRRQRIGEHAGAAAKYQSAMAARNPG